ncbi:hypothetical protein Tco_1338443 [Tanacetum coccineum]
MDKKKKFDLNLEVFRDIFQICPRVHGQNFDELPTNEDIISFFKELGHIGEIKSITDVIGMYYKKNVDYVELLWEDFTYQIDNIGHKKQDKMYYPRFTKVIIHHFLTKDKTVSKRNKIGMHTSRDNYLINTLRFVSTKEESQIYGARLPKSMTSPEMRESKAYKTYLDYATGATPPKKVRKFKKPASPQLTTITVSSEEPIKKTKRVKRSANKSSSALTVSVVKRDTLAVSLSKKKEKVTVEKRKGIDLLFEVALTEEAQYEEVQKKSLRDFHKTHPSGSGIVTKTTPRKDEDDSNNDHDSRSKGSDQERDSGDDNTKSDSEKGSDSEHETDENESGSESDQQENEEDVEDDEEEKDNELVKTPSNSTDDEDEINVEDKAEGDKDEGMDYTTNQFDDDVDLRMNEPVTTDEGFNQKEGTDAEMTNKTEVPVTSSSHSSDLASKFLNFLDIPQTDAEIVSLMDVLVHHEVPSNQIPTLLTVVASVISDSSPLYSTVILQSLQSFTTPPPQSTPTPPPKTEATNPLSGIPNFASRRVHELPSASITTRITEQVKIQLPQILPKKVSNFAPSIIQSMVTESLEHAVLAKESSQPKEAKKNKDKDEDPFAGSDRGLKKRKTSKDAEPTKGPKTKESASGSSKGTKSQSKSSGKFVQSEELEFEVADSDMPQDQDENLGNDDEEPKRKVASKRDWFTKPKQPEDPTYPYWNVGKTLQQGPNQSWLMTLTSSADKPSKTFNELM